MILSDSAILSGIQDGDITIDPFDEKNLGPNSYDLRLGSTLLCYRDSVWPPQNGWHINPAVPQSTIEYQIQPTGFVLQPRRLYLAHTMECAGSTKYVPMIEGRSSVARLGLFIHVTAGFGDVGFRGSWTLELMTVYPFMVYPGMRICQVYFHAMLGTPRRLYAGKYSGGAVGPEASKMSEDFGFDKTSA